MLTTSKSPANDPVKMAELMGHKTIQMTMRYAHLAPAHQLAAVERLAAFQLPAAEPDESAQSEPSATSSATDPKAQALKESMALN